MGAGMGTWMWGWTRTALGLDLGSHAVKLVELGRRGRGPWFLRSQHQAALPHGAVVDGQILQFDAVAATVRALLERAHPQSPGVVMAVPAKHVIQRRTHLPARMHDPELAVHLEAEAASLASIPVEELAVDFAVIGAVAGSPAQCDVQMAVTRKDRVDERVALAQALGLEPLAVESGPNATRWALRDWSRRREPSAAEPVRALFELGPDSLVLHVMADDELLFETAVRFPADWGRPSGLEPARAVALEWARMLQLYYARFPAPAISAVLLAGESDRPEALTEAVAASTGVKAAWIDPFEHRRPSLAADLGDSAVGAAGYLQACGLALRGLG